MSNPLEFGGKVVLVVGGALEAGSEIAETFLAAGAEVIACGPAQAKNLPEAAGQRALFAPLDGFDPEHIGACVDSIGERFGRLDVLVYISAGAPAPASSSSDSAESVIRQGLIIPLHFSQAANRLMQQQAGGGSIINVGPAREPLSSPQPGAEDAANAGLANLGSSLAVEWAPLVRVNTITTDLTQTEQPGSRGGADSAGTGSDSSVIPEGMNRPQTVGKTCLFLASPLASYISGTHLPAGQF